jgi:hypothetical protein
MGNFLSILSTFDKDQVEQMRKDFVNKLVIMSQKEKEFCAENKVPPLMDNDKKNELMRLLDKCGTTYHIEALRRLVLVECIIPTQEQVEELANSLLTEACK